MHHETMRTTLLIQGARENNLRNITVELPRDKLFGLPEAKVLA